MSGQQLDRAVLGMKLSAPGTCRREGHPVRHEASIAFVFLMSRRVAAGLACDGGRVIGAVVLKFPGQAGLQLSCWQVRLEPISRHLMQFFQQTSIESVCLG